MTKARAEALACTWLMSEKEGRVDDARGREGGRGGGGGGGGRKGEDLACMGVMSNALGDSTTCTKGGGSPWKDLRYSPPLLYPHQRLVGSPPCEGVCSTGMRSQPGSGDRSVVRPPSSGSYGTRSILDPLPSIVAP